MRTHPVLLSALIGLAAPLAHSASLPSPEKTAPAPTVSGSSQALDSNAHDSKRTPSAGSAEAPEEAKSPEQKKLEALKLENSLRDEQLKKQLADSSAKLSQLRLEADLLKTQSDRELAARRQKLETQKLEIEEASAKFQLESSRKQAAMEAELVELRAQRDRAELNASLAEAKAKLVSSQAKEREVALNSHMAEVRAKISSKEADLQADSYAEQKPVYLKDPLKADGTLVLSDRRIPLNGPITSETADQIADRIDYYNNKNQEYPIFIVIDDSPGGSVMAGYKILKSMQSSAAPVYVVVKSFAASMAAGITTLAERSFAYPNAIILHHQISGGIAGNLTVQREQVKEIEKWWQRLAGPIAKKMGITTDEFITQMYDHTRTGDWREFADNAAKLKWVDVVIQRCQETSFVKDPDTLIAANGLGGPRYPSMKASEQQPSPEAKDPGLLPRLNPVDCYYLYNPDGYFHIK
jgi:ATP-dependent Clp protease protease subunit